MIKRDQNHEAAARLLQQIAGRRIVTTNHVRGETWTWMRYKALARQGVEFLDNIDGSNSHVEVGSSIRGTMEDEALRWLRQHDEREYSFVDATSFAYMRSKGIEEALAFDGDFAAAGFTELRP